MMSYADSHMRTKLKLLMELNIFPPKSTYKKGLNYGPWPDFIAGKALMQGIWSKTDELEKRNN